MGLNLANPQKFITELTKRELSFNKDIKSVLITVATLDIGPKVTLTEVGNNYANYWAILFNQNMTVNID
jgi:hypothetical protein